MSDTMNKKEVQLHDYISLRLQYILKHNESIKATSGLKTKLRAMLTKCKVSYKVIDQAISAFKKYQMSDVETETNKIYMFVLEHGDYEKYSNNEKYIKIYINKYLSNLNYYKEILNQMQKHMKTVEYSLIRKGYSKTVLHELTNITFSIYQIYKSSNSTIEQFGEIYNRLYKDLNINQSLDLLSKIDVDKRQHFSINVVRDYTIDKTQLSNDVVFKQATKNAEEFNKNSSVEVDKQEEIMTDYINELYKTDDKSKELIDG